MRVITDSWVMERVVDYVTAFVEQFKQMDTRVRK